MKRRLASAARPARAVFRKEVGLAVHDAVGPTQAGLEAELQDLRRIMVDDMDATNEATAIFGRLLARLADRLEEIDGRLQALDQRLDALGAPAPAAAGGSPAPSPAPSQASPPPGPSREQTKRGKGSSAPSKGAAPATSPAGSAEGSDAATPAR